MKRTLNILTPLLALFPLLKLNHFNILFGIWFTLILIHFFQKKAHQNFSIKTFIKTSPVSWHFLIYLLYLPFITDFTTYGNILVQTLYLLIFPFALFLTPQDIIHKTSQKALGIFIFAIGIQNLRGWITLLSEDLQTLMITNDFYNPVFRNAFINSTHIHIPYLGMLSTFAALLTLIYLIKHKKHLILGSLYIIFILCSLYIYSSRMALGAFLFITTYLIWKKIPNSLLKWASTLIIPALSIGIIWFSPIKERYQKSLEQEWILPHAGQQPHEVNYRYGIIHCSLQVIKQHPIFGVFPDQAQHALNNCYKSFTYQSYEDFQKQTYNSHNQYIDYTLKFGIIGGIALLAFCFYYFNQAPSPTFQAFIMLTAISMFTENILDRQLGIVFFSYFFTILYTKKS